MDNKINVTGTPILKIIKTEKYTHIRFEVIFS